MSRGKRAYRRGLFIFGTVFFVTLLAGTIPAFSFVQTVTIEGGDAIFLSGRTDVTIPPASDTWDSGTHLVRNGATPEEIQESLPPYVDVSAGDVIRVLDPVEGGINFVTGFGRPFIGPSGNGVDGSAINSLDGISGYNGPECALVGVFLGDLIPDSGPAPDALNFNADTIGTEFETLSPGLGQVFYIGDGITSTSVFQEFVAPEGATRLFLGLADDLDGIPGAYDDNDGSYQVIVGINELPYRGACCLPNGGCAESFSKYECEKVLYGQYQGDDTLCDPDPCYNPASCFYNNILAFFNQSIKGKLLKPIIPKEVRRSGERSQIKRVKRQSKQSMRRMLGKACELIDKGFNTAACVILEEACCRIDGKGPIKDWFKGEAAAELEMKIRQLMDDLGCP